MPRKIITVLECQKGRIIGSKGSTIRRIQDASGAKVDARAANRIRLDGSKKQIDAAECMIQLILSESTGFKKDSLLVIVPEFTMGFIIGKHRRSLTATEQETETKIFQDEEKKPHFYVKGNPIQQYKAKLKIKETACNCRRMRGFPRYKKFPFIDDRHVGDDSEFSLKVLDDNPHPRWIGLHYKLVSVSEHHLNEEKESEDFKDLCGQIQDILKNLQDRDDGENLLVDMWCHYGQAYFTAVDENELDSTYSLQQIKANLKQQHESWIASFIGGVHQLKVDKIKEYLSEDETVAPYIRCDLAFFSPTCRQIRLKVFLKVSENGEDLTFCDVGPVVVKNVLEKVSCDNGYVYYLCAPPVQHIKVHMFIPFAELDCHFMLRTTFKNISRTPEEKAEDKVLIDFLNENIKINNGKLELPTKQDQLPEGFDMSYWRQSKRRIYSYQGYKIKISEEKLENVNGLQTGEDVKTRNDVHIHCNEWEQKFSGVEWQPDQIVKGVPDFLSFVRKVQICISDQDSCQGEE